MNTPLKHRGTRRHGAAFLFLITLSILAGCPHQPPDTLPPEGKDGDLVISAAGTVLNTYTTLAQDTSSGATAIVVGSLAALTDGANALASGDLLLVIQMQGATLSSNDNASYGEVTALDGAGLYEFAEVEDVTAATNSVSFTAPLIHSYLIAGTTQVVRVPQFTTLTVGAGASVTAPAWDGATGGIVAVTAAQAVMLNGTIDVSGRGFRGGPADNDTSGGVAVAYTGYRSSSSADGARKGEGIGGFFATNGYGRGAPANGGGGGNAYNAGGGGGANGRSGDAWTGQGKFEGTVEGAFAWALDPGYIANGNQLATSAGGGRGGYSCSTANRNALAEGPGNAGWSGNSRREIGGLGGRPLDSGAASRCFFGGGGGAGDGNNSHAGAGGNGGGIMLVIAPRVQGTTGAVLANGEAGYPADSSSIGDPAGDAAGGGGAGGTVIIQAPTIQGITIEARGGAGGSQTVNNAQEAEGPGGGGGGGYVAVSSAVIIDVGGGPGGTTTSPALTEFPVNGASGGGNGETLISALLSVPGY